MPSSSSCYQYQSISISAAKLVDVFVIRKILLLIWLRVFLNAISISKSGGSYLFLLYSSSNKKINLERKTMTLTYMITCFLGAVLVCKLWDLYIFFLSYLLSNKKIIYAFAFFKKYTIQPVIYFKIIKL